MPVLHKRKQTEVPPPSRASRAVREQQQRFDSFVKEIDVGDAGELQLEPGETVRSVKVRLRRASSRMGVDLEIWDANGKVYFRRVTRRGRTRRGDRASAT